MPWDSAEPVSIAIAKLQNASPEYVYEQIKTYGKNLAAFTAKTQLEKELLARNERLINLALAQYAGTAEIVTEIYHQAKSGIDSSYKEGLRVACLSNENFYFCNEPNFDLGEVIKQGTQPEITALLCNSSLGAVVLPKLYKKTDWFMCIEEHEWLSMVQISAKNQRLNSDKNTGGDPDFGLMDIHNAIFEFLKTAPCTEKGMYAALSLLEVLEPKHCFQSREVLDVIVRWRSANIEERNGVYTSKPINEEVACLIAALYGQKLTKKESYNEHLATMHGDGLPLRCAFYGNANLSEADIKEGCEKDKEVFLFAALRNDNVFLNHKSRQSFEEYVSGYFQRSYLQRCYALSRKYKWFNPAPVNELSMIDFNEEFMSDRNYLKAAIDKINKDVIRLSKEVVGMRKIGWFTVSIFALLYYLKH